jgi:hypothetical protein
MHSFSLIYIISITKSLLLAFIINWQQIVEKDGTRVQSN